LYIFSRQLASHLSVKKYQISDNIERIMVHFVVTE